jgi:pimeloyl-ACP methyl ester carboxylesterase
MLLKTNGIELHYEIAGEGEPLLWLHGFMGCGADWKFLWNEPPAGYRLIAPDLRGQGASTNPSRKFTFREAAQDVLGLLRHLKISRGVKAIGLSGGGIALLHMARMEPARFERIVLISAPPYFPEQARRIQRQFSEAMLPDVEKQRMRERHKRGEKQIAELIENTRAFAEDYIDVNFTPSNLAEITAETLIVFGDRDPFYPVSLATELYAAIPKAYLWIVPNGGHGPIFGDNAAKFSETAMGFLRGSFLAKG